MSSNLISKKINVDTQRTIILLVVLYGRENLSRKLRAYFCTIPRVHILIINTSTKNARKSIKFMINVILLHVSDPRGPYI